MLISPMLMLDADGQHGTGSVAAGQVSGRSE